MVQDGQVAAHRAQRTTVAGLAALRIAVPRRPQVLLLPGFTGSKEDFAPVLDAVADAGYGVTAVDLPGQFESPGPDDPAAYTPSALAPVIAAVMDAVLAGSPTEATTDDRPSVGGLHLVGHSFGGLVARATALLRPDRIASLTLLDSGPAAIVGQRRATIELLEPALPQLGLAGLYGQMQKLAAQDPAYVEPAPALADFLRRRFLANSPVMLAGMARALCSEPDRVAELAALQLSVLVLFGARDDAWPPQLQADMARRLGAQNAVIAGAAHSPAIEQPQRTVEILTEFWAGTA